VPGPLTRRVNAGWGTADQAEGRKPDSSDRRVSRLPDRSSMRPTGSSSVMAWGVADGVRVLVDSWLSMVIDPLQ
jgi:hypothetical protein